MSWQGNVTCDVTLKPEGEYTNILLNCDVADAAELVLTNSGSTSETMSLRVVAR